MIIGTNIMGLIGTNFSYHNDIKVDINHKIESWRKPQYLETNTISSNIGSKINSKKK